MRIDLIPDIPTEPDKAHKNVIIAPPTRKHKRVGVQGKKEEGGSKYDQLLQSLYDAAIISNEAGRIVDVNVRAVEFLQYTRAEIDGLTISEIISGADDTLIQKLASNLQNERFTLIQAYCVRKDGTFFPAEVAVNRIQMDSTQYLCFFLRDITLRRQAEEMLRTEHNAIQNSSNGIAIIDLNTDIEYANPAIALMCGLESSDELLGRSICDMFAEPESMHGMLQKVVGEQENWIGEMKGRGGDDGEEVDIQVSAACNKNSDGEVVGVVISLLDIADRKKAETAMREAERHRVMLESLGAACHHLGQPATVLLANLGIMQRKLNGDGDELINELVTSSIEAAETLGDILHKLNAVNEYKTTRYLERPDGVESDENRILDI